MGLEISSNCSDRLQEDRRWEYWRKAEMEREIEERRKQEELERELEEMERKQPIFLKVGSIRSECLENSFLLNTFDPIVVENTINIFMKISTNESNAYEYTIQCFDKLVITAQTNLSENQFNFMIDNSSTISYKNYVLDKLEPLSLYNLTIGYKIKNNDKIFNVSVIESYTCFGTPGDPQNLMANRGKNTLEVSWNRPITINAPDICYYLIEKRFLDQSEGREYEEIKTSFSIIDDLNKNFEVRVSTFNDYKCYKERYPAAENRIN
ncbi:hypothetical protein BpHYR1_046113 [Brachionus plicatilis]|uniref:Fibronectin type-III domain-containing protein n=1 Tax=Brachionus plicatilis TaxID=10195 RepID=A0A3M7QN56_BRAPC|nr:hypothetical protein BpHYR1_046113 [Brachionus plicatilis]